MRHRTEHITHRTGLIGHRTEHMRHRTGLITTSILNNEQEIRDKQRINRTEYIGQSN